jgi:DNA-binding XRE family transcriptional regulator
VAKILLTTDDSVTGWEVNRYEPKAKYIARIVLFLGYIPEEWKRGSLGTQLHYARLVSGMNQEQVAKKIGCDESNLRMIELNKRIPREETSEKILHFIQSTFKSISTQ